MLAGEGIIQQPGNSMVAQSPGGTVTEDGSGGSGLSQEDHTSKKVKGAGQGCYLVGVSRVR